MTKEERLKAAEAHVSQIKHAITNREEILILSAFEAGAEAEAESKWIEVRSGNDLPKDNKDYWAVDKEGNVTVRHGFSILLLNTTHYQPIVKPQPPLNQQ